MPLGVYCEINQVRLLAQSSDDCRKAGGAVTPQPDDHGDPRYSVGLSTAVRCARPDQTTDFVLLEDVSDPACRSADRENA